MADNTKTRRPILLWLLVLLLVVEGITAGFGGLSLVLKPDGSGLQLPPEFIQNSPFPNYFIPGLVLFTLVGLYPILVAFCLLFKPGWHWPDALNPWKGYHWSWAASLAAGIIIMLWIIVQYAMLRIYFILQPIIFAWGLAIVLLTVLPPVRRYCKR